MAATSREAPAAAAREGLGEEDRELVLAAAHIEDARTGRGQYGRARYYFQPKHAQYAFVILTSKWFQRAFTATVLLHSALVFLEPPSVSPRSMETYAAIVLNFLCLLLYLADVVLSKVFLSWRLFWTLDECAWNRLQFLLLCGFAVDWVLLLAQATSGNNQIVQPFRCLRLAMIMCKAKNIGHIFNVVRSITLKLGGIVLIVLLFLLLYSCVGVHLVMPAYQAINTTCLDEFRDANKTEPCLPGASTENLTNIFEGSFNHVGTATVHMFVLLTTENYPVFMFPAYLTSQWYFIYFGSFIFIGVFFLTAILLAIIANLYWKYNKKHVKRERGKQRAELVKAWQLLAAQGEESLSLDDPKLVKLFAILKPTNTTEENAELAAMLDPEGCGHVQWIHWVTQLLTVLTLEKTAAQQSDHAHKCWSYTCYSVLAEYAKKICAWAWFEKIVVVLIASHTLLFALKWRGMSLEAELAVQVLRTTIVILFVLEMFLRLCASGSSYFAHPLGTADLLLVAVALLCSALWYVSLARPLTERVGVGVVFWRGCVVVVSSLAVFSRLFFNSAQSRRVMLVFFRLFPIMWDLIAFLCIVLFFYAVIGMEAFRHFPLSEATPSSDYLQYGCGLGFKDFKCSLYIMFQILTTSNWHEILYTVIISLDSYAPLVFFISGYIVVNLVIMNLLVAIGIEAFNKFTEEEEEASPADDGGGVFSKLASFVSGAFSRSSTGDAESGSMEPEYGNDGVPIPVRPPSGRKQRKVSFATTPMASEEDFPPSTPPLEAVSSSSSQQQLLRTHSSLVIQKSDGSCQSEQESTKDDVIFEEQSETLVYSEKTDSMRTEVVAPTTERQESRQDKLRRRMKERQKQRKERQKPAVLMVVNESQESGNDVNSEGGEPTEATQLSSKASGRSVHWGAATQALSFIHSSSRSIRKGAEGPADGGEEEGSSDKHPHTLTVRQNSINSSSKFRKGFNHGNWRSEVQNITIINKEELSELKRQLAASRPTLQRRQRTSFALGESAERKAWPAPRSIIKSSAAAKPNSSGGPLSRRAPTVTFSEPFETKATSPLPDSRSHPEQRPASGRPEGEEVPSWVLKLTQQYNVAVHTTAQDFTQSEHP